MNEYILDSYAGNTLRRHRFEKKEDAYRAVALLKSYYPEATGELQHFVVFDNDKNMSVLTDTFKF